MPKTNCYHLSCFRCGTEVVLCRPADRGRIDHWRRVGRTFCSAECTQKTVSEESSLRMAETNRKYAAERMKKNNPMHMPGVADKMRRTLRRMQWKPQIHGGNGTGYTVPQRTLTSALGDGWHMELAVPTQKLKQEGYPSVYKIDIAHTGYMIAIEVDGATHYPKQRMTVDQKKTDFLNGLGWTVLRFSNKAAMEHTEECCQMVWSTISKLKISTLI